MATESPARIRGAAARSVSDQALVPQKAPWNRPTKAMRIVVAVPRSASPG